MKGIFVMSHSDKNPNKTAVAYLDQLKQIGSRLQPIFERINNQQEQLEKIAKPLVEIGEALNKTFEPLFSESNKWKYAISTDAIERLSPIIEQGKEFRKLIEKTISPAFIEIQRTFRDLPPRTQKALLVLGEHGWFFDLNMPVSNLWELEEALTEGDIQDADRVLINYFDKRIDAIENAIVEKFPMRQKIISAAFTAHRRGEYELSIPVLLAQTDGICKDVAKEHLFLKQNRKPRTAIYVEKTAANAFTAALLSPLAETLPIGASENERHAEFDELNRHLVLHGESLDYGNKTNSLKAISLLNYVVQVLETDD